MDDFEQLPKMAGWHEGLTAKSDPVSVTISQIRPNHVFLFHQMDAHGWGNGPLVGSLDFNGSEMKFVGDADASAKVFFDFLAKHFYERLREEYKLGYEHAKNGKEPHR